MKAAVLSSKQNIEVQEIPAPGAPEADECTVEVAYAGVCSSDIDRSFGGGAYFYPLIMGHEFSGTIKAVGQNAGQFRVGQKVGVFPLLPCFKCDPCHEERYAQCTNYSYYGSRRHGGFSQALNVKQWNLLPIEDGIELIDVACLEPLAVAINTLRVAGLLETGAPSRKVALLGAGFIGLLMLQVLKAQKCPHAVKVIDRNEFKLKLAADLGVQTQTVKSAEELEKFGTDFAGAFDIVIEATGVPSYFASSLTLARARGLVTWMGNPSGDVTLPKKLVSSILRKELELRGVWNSVYRPGKMDDWQLALKLMKQGLKPHELITSVIPLDQLPQTMAKLYGHKAGGPKYESIKVMVKL